MVIDELAWSATVPPRNSRGPNPTQTGQATRSPLEHVRRAPAAEVADVDALGAADPGPPDQWVVHVPEEHQRRLGVTDRLEQGAAPPLQPARLHVVEQLRHGRRDVRAQDV